jgi:hypothetical protein
MDNMVMVGPSAGFFPCSGAMFEAAAEALGSFFEQEWITPEGRFNTESFSAKKSSASYRKVRSTLHATIGPILEVRWLQINIHTADQLGIPR